MGATNNIKTLFFTSDLLAQTCSQCDAFFTDKDFKNDNWDLEYRTNSNIDFSRFREGTSKGQIAVIIELYHGDCPEEKQPRKPRVDRTVRDAELELNEK